MNSNGNGQGAWARPGERPFLKRIADWTDKVAQTQSWLLTDFLTPREQFLLTQSLASFELELVFFGGNLYAERQRALLMPGDWQPIEDDFQISVLCATPIQTSSLSHGSVLGSVLGTGLDRKKIGDIFLQNGKAYVFCVQDVASFLLAQWHQIGRDAVAVESLTTSIEWVAPIVEKTVISSASFRADAVLAQSCHWSRGQAQEAIERGRVSLNFLELSKPDTELAMGDVLSVRGFGRVQVLHHLGRSKKERERIEVGVYKSQSKVQS